MTSRTAVPALAVALLSAAALAGPPAGGATTGDPVRGEQIYARCLACHSLEMDRTGPRHCGLLGRKAGAVPGFDYSEAMKASGITWTEASLDRFLADPLGVIPGTKMTFAGVPDAAERADLIAWLSSVSADPKRCEVPSSEGSTAR